MNALAPTYSDARGRVLAAADSIGARRTSAVHPLVGLDDEELAIDVAVVGAEDAPAAVVLVSGTHGVEGYTGSALQSHWMEEHAATRPDDVAFILVHGLNPYGFSWVRRVNEDNVDLNRNFVDWSAGPPANERYGGVAALLVPESWHEDTQRSTTERLLEEASRVGFEKFQEVVSAGQYGHPTGVFYGGTEPVWSHRWLVDELPQIIPPSARIGLIDLHTGLGSSGHGELIIHELPDTPGHQRAAEWWGEVRSMASGESVSAMLTGDWLGVIHEVLARHEVTAAALEFGTVDTISVLQALRADAWLHAHGDPVADDAAMIRAQVRAAFASDETEGWLDSVTARFDEVVSAAVANLSSLATGRLTD